MKRFKQILVIVCGLVGAIACQSSDPVKKLSDADYLPLKKNFFQLYDVNSITYTDLNPPETLAYQLMTQVVDSFPNQEGFYTYVIHRSTRPDSTSEWTSLDTWSAKVNGQQAVVSEENTPFVKLTFPVSNNRKWNGNALNTNGENDYKMENTGMSVTIGTKSYADCITVVQNDDDNLVNTDIRKEIYSRNVGLISAEKTQLNYCTDIDCFGQKKIKDGIVYKQTIYSHGSN